MGTPEANRSLRTYLRRSLHSELTRVWLPAVCVLTIAILAMSVFLSRSQEQSRVELEQRYALRATLATRFVSAYVADIHERERAYAASFLSARVVTPERFALVAGAFGFDAAVLLDSHGRVLSVLPSKPALIGTRLDTTYQHLRTAVGGAPAVSDVVPSAARSLPIVAVAVPFATPSGRRVFSGGTQIEHSPLAAFLADGLPYKGARSYLIDSKGFVIVSGGARVAALARPPDTAGTHGAITLAGIEYRFASVPIPRTSWRLLTVAPCRSAVRAARRPAALGAVARPRGLRARSRRSAGVAQQALAPPEGAGAPCDA